MLSIWKFPLVVSDEQLILMPQGGKILALQAQSSSQGQTPVLWALVDPAARKVARRIVCRGTGHPILTDLGIYIATIQFVGNALVFHWFDKGEE